eukprot:14876249-Alexandrium_andersonii.AAC.1
MEASGSITLQCKMLRVGAGGKSVCGSGGKRSGTGGKRVSAMRGALAARGAPSKYFVLGRGIKLLTLRCAS